MALSKQKKYKGILEYLLENVSAAGNKDLFVMRRKIRKEIVRYSELADYLVKIDKLYKALGVKSGEKILIWGLNCPEYALLLLGAFSSNRVVVPIDYRNSEEMIGKVCDKTAVKIAFVSKYIRSGFLKERGIRLVMIEDLFDLLKNFSGEGLTGLRKRMAGLDDNRLVEIVFTSGTTGTPKGVMISERNVLSNLSGVLSILPDWKDGWVVSIMPLSHMLEQMIGLLLVIGKRASVVYLTKVNGLSLLRAYREYRPTHQVLVPQMLRILWDRIETKAKESGQFPKMKFALSVSKFLPRGLRRLLFREVWKLFGGRLSLFACGGAPLDVEVGRKFEAMGFEVIEGYGATEVTAVATFNRLNQVRLGTCGKAIEGVEISLDENGEVYIKSPSIALGYLNDKEKTDQAFTKNGYRTGDIGEFDKDGYLRIKGRDVFKIVLASGEKVFVEDLEAIVRKDKRVADCCIVAKKKADGDTVHGYFLLKDEFKGRLEEVVTDINLHLESKQQIMSFEIWSEVDFPRTVTMKVDRKLMYKVANEGEVLSGQGNAETTVNLKDIRDILGKLSGLPREAILDSMRLGQDLKMDSLSRVELVSLIEEYLGKDVPESEINAQTRVVDLERLVLGSGVVEEVIIPRWQFGGLGMWLHKMLLQLIVFPIHGLIVKIEYNKREWKKIEPGSVIVFNHCGVGDGFSVLRALAGVGRFETIVGATASVWRKGGKFPKLFEVVLGAIPLYDSGQGFIKVLQTFSDMLDSGFVLWMNPQGRIQRTKIEEPFLPGIGVIVKELQRKVYVAKLVGYREIWPAPAENLLGKGLMGMLPKKRGKAKLILRGPFGGDWDGWSTTRITNYLEEKYLEISSNNPG